MSERLAALLANRLYYIVPRDVAHVETLAHLVGRTPDRMLIFNDT
jgi:hypothetical protein